MAANAAILFETYAFDTGGKKLMGAQSASDGFLSAFVRYSGVDCFHCVAPDQTAFAKFASYVKAISPSPQAPVEWIPKGYPEKLRNPGCLYQPQPAIAEQAWQRRHYDERAYSICGVTHTTCSAAVMDAIGSYHIAPLHNWDAIICTSSAVKATIDHVHQQWSNYLAERLQAQPSANIQLPVIPLGVDCDAFERGASDRAGRTALRAEMGIAEEDIAILYLGRLSFHAKAHPLPMYLALEQAAQRTGKRLHLIQAGWFPNSAVQDEFTNGAKRYCPSVKTLFVDGRQHDVRTRIWFAADIFTSLSDNIQETFGMVPIEAMAAGLPQVISDWNGYRDTVRHGVDGFRVPTSMPAAGTGQDIAQRHAFGIDSYDRYIGHSGQCTAVDVGETAEAYVNLIENETLRRSMGEAGRKRAREQFDWRVVVQAYQDLWSELAQRRQHASASPSKANQPPHPLREDPFALFAGYPTETLQSETVLELAGGANSGRLNELYASPLANYVGAPFLLASQDECLAVLSHMAKGPTSISELLDHVDRDRQFILHRTLGWLAKMNLVRVIRPERQHSAATGIGMSDDL